MSKVTIQIDTETWEGFRKLVRKVEDACMFERNLLDAVTYQIAELVSQSHPIDPYYEVDSAWNILCELIAKADEVEGLRHYLPASRRTLAVTKEK